MIGVVLGGLIRRARRKSRRGSIPAAEVCGAQNTYQRDILNSTFSNPYKIAVYVGDNSSDRRKHVVTYHFL